MPTITMMDIGSWLRSLGLEQYEATFCANAVDADVLRDLTDQDLQKLGVLLGHRHKLLRAIAALASAFAPASAPRPTPLPISPGAILAAAAAGAFSERQQGEDYSVSPSPPSPISSPRRPAEMISDRFLPKREETTLWLAASDDSDSDDIQTADTGEAHGEHDYHDNPATMRWRYRLVMATAAIALAGLGVVSAFAYRAVFAGAVLPALPPIIKAENAPNDNVQNEGDNQPRDLSQTSIASAGSSEEFVSRFPADNQEPPKTAAISPNPSASPPSALGWAVAPMATTPPASLPSVAPPPEVAAPVPAPSSSTPKKIKSVISRRSDGSGQTGTSAATAKSPAAKPSAAAAALPVGRPLSLAPDAHDHSAASPPPRSHMPAGTATAAEASSGGGYAVAVASERSAADADAVFRSLQAKFPDQLGGHEPIVRRTDLGPEGTYYRTSIGPFVSKKEAARVCSSLKAAGESCLVEKN
jgi:hypothetical protein